MNAIFYGYSIFNPTNWTQNWLLPRISRPTSAKLGKSNCSMVYQNYSSFNVTNTCIAPTIRSASQYSLSQNGLLHMVIWEGGFFTGVFPTSHRDSGFFPTLQLLTNNDMRSTGPQQSSLKRPTPRFPNTSFSHLCILFIFQCLIHTHLLQRSLPSTE